MSLYDTADCEDLGPLEQRLREEIASIGSFSLQHLSTMPQARALLEGLTARERADLDSCLGNYLVSLASPRLTEVRHRVMATRVGVVHAATGLAKSDLARCYENVMAAVRMIAGDRVDTLAVVLYGQRLARDLQYQSEAQRAIDAERRSVCQCIAELALTADSYVTLADGICESLAVLTEVVACAVARPDASGDVYFEATRSALSDASIFAIEEEVRSDLSRRPFWRAWDTGKTLEIAHTPSSAAKADTHSHSRLCLDLGIRSGAVIPLGPHGRPPKAVVMVYSGYPGGLGSVEQRAFLWSIKALLDLALERLGVFESATGPVPYTVRNRVRALLNEGGLDMHYQPIVELKSGNVIKVEALARLRDGNRLLMPGDFLPALSGEQLLELYAQGLEQALRQRTVWARQGVTLGLSVNLPHEALDGDRYYEATRAALAVNPCPPGTLTLELLESGEASAGVARVSTMRKFKALGVQLAEDDLGAGYSSLTRLRQFPFDWIKLDRGIISLADGDNTDALRFIFQLTRLGHGLGKRVVVEGIETAGLREAARLLGVDAAQGYGIGPPMPAGEVVPWSHKQREQRVSSHPSTSLGRQACLLMFEERLHLQAGSRSSANEQPHRRMSWQVDELEAELDAIGNANRDCAQATKALLHAAVSQGVSSPEYRQARRDLVAVI
ncbi:EAL domain-containing protein [Cupriavidus metallidurans]|uniref:EAL domain-containing protein n=1 Tax=Cupriavidus metallidurans TaxID=119219 RepID=UPI0006913722|nr:EAL domain-containing protein [Cupriavidus metallidurans]MDE4920636.1 EAL domain-containing protein [Cupriavidus metallidurans]